VSHSGWYVRFFTGLYSRVLARQFRRSTSTMEARTVKRLLRVRRGARVLDVPCGQGRLTIPLARMGLGMTGVDLAPGYITQACRQATRSRLRIDFIRGDMREMDFHGEFDAAFNWFGSFGYFSDADNLSFCRAVRRALKPGGRFLVEGPNKHWILANFRPRMESVYGGVRIHQSSRWDRRESRIVTRWIFMRGRKVERHTSRMRIYGGADIRKLLTEAGFRDIRLYGRRPVGPFHRYSPRLVAVATRPKTPS
jgi:SAM-dependent methyltransferase